MSKKLISACTSLALVAGLLLVASPATQAQTGAAPANVGLFQPNNFEQVADADEQKTVLSDAFDGTDEAAHVTAVASANATEMTFFVCAPSQAGMDIGARGAALQDPAQCQSFGADTNLNQPIPPDAPTFFPGSLKAGSTMWNIPSGLDQAIVTIAARACAGSPSSTQTNNNMPDNCRADWEDDIVLDDGSTPAFPGTPRQFETGNIVGICLDSAANCLPFGVGAGTGTGTYEPFPHGSRLPRAGRFSLSLTTSNGADPATATGALATVVGACVDTMVDLAVSHGSTGAARAGNDIEPTNCAVQADSVTLTANPSGHKEWVADFSALNLGAPGDRTNVDVALFGARGPGSPPGAPCQTAHFTGTADTCVYDEHFAVAADLARQASGTFQFSTQTPLPAGSGNCAQPRETESNRLGSGVTVFVFCLFDAAGQPVANEPVTFQHPGAPGPAGAVFSGCAPGTAPGGAGVHSHPPAPGNVPQLCHTTTDGSGLASVGLTNPDLATNEEGDQVVTACRDPEATLPAHPDHGCANAPAAERTVGTKTWKFTPDNVILVFEGTGDPADPCNTGDQAKTNFVDDLDTLLACVFDQFGRPADTNNTGIPTETQAFYQLTWTRNVACQAVGFAGPLATETGSDGRATIQIQAVQTGSCTVTVTLSNAANLGGPGGVTFTVSKNVQSDPGRIEHDDPRTIGLRRFRGPRLRPRRIRVVGRVRVANDHLVCVDQVPVRVQRRFLRGRGSQRFNTLRTITTGGPGGVYRTNLFRPVRAHRIRVIAVPIKIDVHNCMRAVNSRRVRRR